MNAVHCLGHPTGEERGALYAITVLRLVNGLVEEVANANRQTKVGVLPGLEALGLPRMDRGPEERGEWLLSYGLGLCLSPEAWGPSATLPHTGHCRTSGPPSGRQRPGVFPVVQHLLHLANGTVLLVVGRRPGGGRAGVAGKVLLAAPPQRQPLPRR